MKNAIRTIALKKLVPHPDNPNKMSCANFAKLVHNIERTGRYEPLVVRTHPKDHSLFEIINGYHRCKALRELGHEEVDCVVWEMNDEQADILLGTLNRLCGTDELGKKVKILKRLNKGSGAGELSKLLPQTAKQIERLTNLKMPRKPAKMPMKLFANPMVFFLTDEQQEIIERALSLAKDSRDEKAKIVKNAAALTHIAKHFLNHSNHNFGGF